MSGLRHHGRKGGNDGHWNRAELILLTETDRDSETAGVMLFDHDLEHRFHPPMGGEGDESRSGRRISRLNFDRSFDPDNLPAFFEEWAKEVAVEAREQSKWMKKSL